MREKKNVISSLKFWETPDPYPDSIAITVPVQPERESERSALV